MIKIVLLCVCLNYLYSFEFTEFVAQSTDPALLAHLQIDRFNYILRDATPIKSAKVRLVKYALSDQGIWLECNELFPTHAVSRKQLKNQFNVSVLISPSSKATIVIDHGCYTTPLSDSALYGLTKIHNGPLVGNTIVLYKSDKDPNHESNSKEGWDSYLGIEIILNNP